MKSKISDCLCVTCGTTKEDQNSGFCENGHDDWYEGYRERHQPTLDRVMKKIKPLGLTVETVDELLESNNWEGLKF